MMLNYNCHTAELSFNRETLTEPSSCSVLIIDDDSIARLVLQRCLLHHNPQLHIEMADSGESALHLFQKKLYPLVFLSLFLPDMNGFELHPRFRQIAGSSPIAIIGHTVQVDKSTDLLQAGFTAFLPKPFTTEELQSLLLRISPIIDFHLQTYSHDSP